MERLGNRGFLELSLCCGAFRSSAADTRVSRYLRKHGMQDLAWQA